MKKTILQSVKKHQADDLLFIQSKVDTFFNQQFALVNDYYQAVHTIASQLIQSLDTLETDDVLQTFRTSTIQIIQTLQHKLSHPSINVSGSLSYREIKQGFKAIESLMQYIENLDVQYMIFVMLKDSIAQVYSDQLTTPVKSTFMKDKSEPKVDGNSSMISSLRSHFKEKLGEILSCLNPFLTYKPFVWKYMLLTARPDSLVELEQLVEWCNKMTLTDEQHASEPFTKHDDASTGGNKTNESNEDVDTTRIVRSKPVANNKNNSKKCKHLNKINDMSNHLCVDCGMSFHLCESENFQPSFDDIERLHSTVQYRYEKRCHFRDTINQYQGKENKIIPKKVFEDLDYMLEKHGLLNVDATNQKDRYVRVKKPHMRKFLVSLKYTKYYEDDQLIYSELTGAPKPDISKYEKQLYEDFDALLSAFIQLKIERKNFLNSHYVLRQLLLRQGVKVSEGDLTRLKTLQRERVHDEIYQQCCEILSWNFSPLS